MLVGSELGLISKYSLGLERGQEGGYALGFEQEENGADAARTQAARAVGLLGNERVRTKALMLQALLSSHIEHPIRCFLSPNK